MRKEHDFANAKKILCTKKICAVLIGSLLCSVTGGMVTPSVKEAGSIDKVYAATSTTEKAADSVDEEDNKTMMQGFEWYTKNDGTYWKSLSAKANHLAYMGITSVWLPPAYKCDSGKNSVGYDVYDLYDLGEFNQKGTVRTKYGTKDEYISLINSLHKNDIEVYADAVMNHKCGADGTQVLKAYMVDGYNRNRTIGSAQNIRAWTVFNFAGRNNKYSSFKWDSSCFDGVDWDDMGRKNAIFRFSGKSWDRTSYENGNYDYLMGADLDLNSSKVRNELKNWGEWYVNTANLDGFRIDAVKHMEYSFVEDWLTSIEKKTGKEVFAVSEYLDGNVENLKQYIRETGGTTSLFDYALFYKFRDACRRNGTNLTYLVSGTLTSADPDHSVTFVDNHDQQAGRSGDTIATWFRPLAYTFILTRQEGTPCVFYSDYYGSESGNTKAIKQDLDELLFARKYFAYGTQTPTNSTANGTVIGWARQGDKKHKGSGLASVISSNKQDKTITLNVGKQHAGEKWIDILGNSKKTVKISSTGNATFEARAMRACVYVNSAAISKKISVKKATNLKKVSVSDKTVKLKWNSIPNVTGYRIYKYIPSTKKWVTAKDVDVNCAWVSNLAAATSVKFKVRGYVKIGEKTYYGDMSDSITCCTLPSKVTLKATPGVGKIKLSWKKPCNNIKGYKIYYSTSKNGSYKLLASVGPKATSKVVTGLKKGKKYYYKIKAYRYKGSKASDGLLMGAMSNAASATVK